LPTFGGKGFQACGSHCVILSEAKDLVSECRADGKKILRFAQDDRLMPELPEVETVRRGLLPRVLGRTIEDVRVHEARLRWPVTPAFATQLRGRTIHSVERRAKYLLLSLGSGADPDQLILHLGMSGRLFVLPAGTPRRKHDHLDLQLSGDVLLRFHDPRRFGAALYWPAALPAHPLLAHLGPEPFSPAFSGDHLFRRSRGRRVPVKNFLMDGRIVVGVGNIYASESLFRAGVRPTRAAGRVTRAEYARLADAVRAVLSDAIEQGGTTLKDSAFTDTNGDFGYFQLRLSVYDREDQPCRRCKANIRRVVVGQRSSFYCPGCQR
jgi:formamidopyrimidine-DNA glycosylase